MPTNNLSATLDVMSEHAVKIFQSVDLTFASVNAIVGDLSDEDIKASEQALHLKLSELDKVAECGRRHSDSRQKRTSAGVVVGLSDAQRS